MTRLLTACRPCGTTSHPICSLSHRISNSPHTSPMRTAVATARRPLRANIASRLYRAAVPLLPSSTCHDARWFSRIPRGLPLLVARLRCAYSMFFSGILFAGYLGASSQNRSRPLRQALSATIAGRIEFPLMQSKSDTRSDSLPRTAIALPAARPADSPGDFHEIAVRILPWVLVDVRAPRAYGDSAAGGDLVKAEVRCAVLRTFFRPRFYSR